MAGLLTHLGIAVGGFLIIFIAFYKAKPKIRAIYVLGFAIGELLPDLVDFGVLAVKMRSLNVNAIMQDPLFNGLMLFGHTLSNWLIIAMIFIAIFLFVYEIEKMSKKGLVAIIIGTALVLLGIAVHLWLDVLIQETSHWI